MRKVQPLPILRININRYSAKCRPCSAALAFFSRGTDEASCGFAFIVVFLPLSPLSTDLLDIKAKRQFYPHKRFESCKACSRYMHSFFQDIFASRSFLHCWERPGFAAVYPSPGILSRPDAVALHHRIFSALQNRGINPPHQRFSGLQNIYYLKRIPINPLNPARALYTIYKQVAKIRGY